MEYEPGGYVSHAVRWGTIEDVWVKYRYRPWDKTTLNVDLCDSNGGSVKLTFQHQTVKDAVELFIYNHNSSYAGLNLTQFLRKTLGEPPEAEVD